MIDFHSHILPGMDDGARDLEMSLKMLEESAAQGVSLMCATPHFYAEENSPQEFLKRRKEAIEILKPNLREEFPEIKLGAEVMYFEGICRVKDIELLKIEDTDILLLEMPSTQWTSRMWHDVEELSSRPNTRVMLAHIERYLQFGAEKYLTNSSLRCILIQSNAENFLAGFFQRHKAIKMLKSGLIDVLGSDSHNVTSRAQKLKQAREVIADNMGEEALYRIDKIGSNVFGYPKG